MPAPREKLTGERLGEPSSVVAARVEAARERQRKRFASHDSRVVCNADMTPADVRVFCKLDAGINLNLSTDFEDDLCYIGAAVDVGADEFGDAALINSTQTAQIGVQPRSGQQISIAIPPGAVGGTGIIRLAPIVTPTQPLPPRRQSANISFDLRTQPSSTLSLAAVPSTFLSPILIEVKYTDADVAGMSESVLELLAWDDAMQRWQPAHEMCASPGLPVRQPDVNALSVPACATGEYALAGRPHEVHLPIVVK